MASSALNVDILDCHVTDAALWPLIDEIIDDLAMEVIFASHMEAKMGVLFLHEELLAAEHGGGRVSSRIGMGGNGLGGERSSSDSEPPLFGQPAAKLKPVMCRCPNCNRSMAALRFAPHLEKCMGMGRVSSRLASRRIAIQHRYSDDSDSDDHHQGHQHHHHHQPPMKQRRSIKRSSTAPGNVANLPPPPPPPQFHDAPSAAPGSGAVAGGDDDWDGLSTPSPSSVSTGSSGGGGGGNAVLAKVALQNRHQHEHHHHSRR